MRRALRPGAGVVSVAFLGACGACLVVAAACSSSSSGGGGAASGGDGGGNTSSSGGGPPASCTSTTALQIHFAPMYSAFLTDETGHQTFQVPAVATGGSGAATWTASDDAAVSFTADPTSGGTLITVKSATPTVTITAQSGTLCGSTTLNITSALQADWNAGNARYNNGVPVYPGCVGAKLAPQLAEAGIDLPPPPDGGCPTEGPACTGCHGPNPTGGFFKGVLHTPEQTAGFSDEDLVNIFVNGTVPDGGEFNQSILPYYYWNRFHTWSDIATPEQQKAMVVYLRSLQPASEEGGLDFGGLEEAGISAN